MCVVAAENLYLENDPREEITKDDFCLSAPEPHSPGRRCLRGSPVSTSLKGRQAACLYFTVFKARE